MRHVPKTCSYCQGPDSVELISHLLWSCPVVSNFLNDVFTFISSTGTAFLPSQVQFLFGNTNYEAYQTQKYISLILKKKTLGKQKSKKMAIDRFKALLKSYLNDLTYMLDYKNMSDKYSDWDDIQENL